MRNKIIKILLVLILFVLPQFAFAEEQTAVIPSDAKLEYNHGIDCYKLGQYEEAIASFRTAIRLCPDYIDAYYNLGSLLDYLKQADEALSVFEQIISRKPDEYEAIYNAAKLSAQLGDKANATKYLEMIPKSSGYYSKTVDALGRCNVKPQSVKTNPSNKNQTPGCYPNITSPTGVTSDKYGNLYVSSFTDNAIFKIQPDGKRMLFYKSPNLKGPISLSSDSEGNIYVANYNANNVLKLSHSGVCTVLTSDVIQPYGVHVDGNILFVACQGTNSVLRLKIK